MMLASVVLASPVVSFIACSKPTTTHGFFCNVRTLDVGRCKQALCSLVCCLQAS
jgi:hypothetical protein